MDKNTLNKQIWIRIAQISGAFAIIISILLVVNYAQYKSIDPIETELINSLITRLNYNPDDIQLREEVRALDLLSRKAYFTNQWQVRTGGYLFLIAIGILVIAMQIIKNRTAREVLLTDKENSFIEHKNSRKWVAIGGTVITVITLTFAFLTHNELSKFPVNTTSENILNDNTEQDNIIIVEQETKIQPNIDIVSETTEETIGEKEKPAIAEIKSITSESKTLNQEPKNNIEVIDTIVKNNQETKILPDTKENDSGFPSFEEIKNNHNSFRGPGGNGISFHKNIPVSWNGVSGENILWKLKIPLHGYNSPIVWGNKVFVSGASVVKREVYCIDGNTGKIIWTVDVANIPGSPAKSPKVTDDTGLAAPSLTTDGVLVYAIFGNGDLIAIDMDGNQVWARNLGDAGNHYGHSSSLLLFQDILILQYDIKKSPKLIGLSTIDGRTIWETNRNVKISWASPIVVNTGTETEIIIVF